MYVENSHAFTQAKVQKLFIEAIGETTFAVWFRTLALDAIAGATAYVSIATPYLAKRIRDSHQDALLRAFQKETPTIERVEISARSFNKLSACDDPPQPKVNVVDVAPASLPSAQLETPIVLEVSSQSCEQDGLCAELSPSIPVHAENNNSEEISIPTTEARELLEEHTGRILIDKIIRVICAEFKIDRAVLIGSTRVREIVLPRHIAFFLAHHLTVNSLPAIGRRFGGRDHTTVLHGIRKVEELIKTDVELALEVATIEANLRGMELSLQDS